MRLAMRQEDGFAILDVLGEIDSHNFSVLKAGLTKLLQNGKNRIILHVIESKDMSSDVLRELAILDVYARELSGRILVATENIDIKSKVKTFAKPPVIAILPSVQKAMEYSQDLDVLEGDELGESVGELSKKLEAAERKILALEGQIRLLDGKEARDLRAQNAELASKVELLEAQVAAFLADRWEPTHADGFLEKFEVLEHSVKALSGEKLQGAKK